MESRGEAWYIHPENGKRYYMEDGNDAYKIMRFLSLGITNTDLEPIGISQEAIDCGGSIDCLYSAIENDVDVSALIDIVNTDINLKIVFRLTHSTNNTPEIYEAGYLLEYFETPDGQYENDDVLQALLGYNFSELANNLMGDIRYECMHSDREGMLHLVNDLKTHNITNTSEDFALCEGSNGIQEIHSSIEESVRG